MRYRIVSLAVLLASSVYILLHLLLPPIVALSLGRGSVTSTPADWGYTYENIELRGAGARANIWYLEHPRPKAQILLLAHNGGNRSAPLMRWTAELLYSEGYSVALADPRGQGDTGGIKTYGIGEAVDAAAAVDELASRYPGLPIGGFGYSLGAATIIRVMGMDNRLAAAVAFAPYSRFDSALLRQELRFQTDGRWNGEGLILPLISAAFRLWAFSSVHVPDPMDAVGTLDQQSLLLLHYTDDPEMLSVYSVELHEAGTRSDVLLHFYKGSVHLPWQRSGEFENDFRSRVAEFFSGVFLETRGY